MKNKISAIRNHVSRHRGTYGVALGAGAVAYLTYKSHQELNAFLKEHDLYDAFYTPEIVGE